MPPALRKDIVKFLEDFIITGKFEEALEGFNSLLEEGKLSDDEILYAKMFKSEIILLLSVHDFEDFSFQESLDLAQEVVAKLDKSKDDYLKVGALMILGSNHFIMNNWSEFLKIYSQYIDDYNNLKPIKELYYTKLKAVNYLYSCLEPFIRAFTGATVPDEEKNQIIQLFKEALRFTSDNNLKLYQGQNLYNLSVIYYWKGDLEGYLDTRKKFFEICKSYDSKIIYAYGLGEMAGTYQTLNDFKKSFEYLKEKLLILEDIGSKKQVADTIYQIGYHYFLTGDYDEALQNFRESLDFYETIGNELRVASIQRSIGNIYFLTGELNKALDSYNKAFQVLESNKPQSWRYFLTDLAAVFTQMGDFDKALEYLDRVIPLHQAFQDNHAISSVFSDQGVIFWQKGMKDKGLQLMEKSLKMRENLGDRVREAESLAYLIQFNIEMKKPEKAKKYFEELTLINKELDSKLVNQNHKFSEALILKASSDNRDRIKSEVLFEQLIEEDSIYPILVQVLLNLCDILIVEIEESDSKDAFEKLKNYVSKLQELAEKNKCHLLLVQVLELKSQISLIDLDIEAAKSHLLEAQILAQGKGLDDRVLNLLKQQEDLTKHSMEIKKLKESDSTISSRISLVDLSKNIEKLRNTSLSKPATREEVSKKLLSIQI